MVGLAVLLVISLFFISIHTDDLSRCPPAVKDIKYFSTFRERCYEFATYREEYWADAQNQCHHKGGRLATVPDLATQQFFISALNNLKYAKTGIWIGLSDRKTETRFEWDSGDPVTFTYWADEEPDTSILHGIQDCVLMKYESGYHWFDHPCHLWPEYFSFICEYDMTPKTNSVTVAITSETAMTTPVTYSAQATTFPLPETTTLHTTYSKDRCGDLVCSLDCGLAGFETDTVTGCAICVCANNLS